LFALTSAVCVLAAAPAAAQTSPAAPAQRAASSAPEQPWTFDFGLGWDHTISGNINAGGIGVLNGQTVVILPNRYEDAYGTGLYLRFAGGYKINPQTEVRASLTFQSLDADLVELGDIGSSTLYGQYDPYKSLTLDVGVRRYAPSTMQSLKFYAEGTIGLGFISELDVELSAPGSNQTFTASDFYDATAAFSLAGSVGVLFTVHKQLDLNMQLGLRYMTGLSAVDAFEGTGLDDINSGSRRWTIPFVIGLSTRF
jgi:hypothetical protein